LSKAQSLFQSIEIGFDSTWGSRSRIRNQ